MTDALDQFEVDALLAAIDTGAVPHETSRNDHGSRPWTSPDVKVYDFKRPPRFSNAQRRALATIHDRFARNFSAALSDYLRATIEVNLSGIAQITYAEFIQTLPNPTCFNLLKAEQLDGQLCLEISPLIIFPIIDRLLGGGSADQFIPQRPLTDIEQRLVQCVTHRATHHLSQAWSDVTPTAFQVDDIASDPRGVQIVPANEAVVVVAFQMTMGNRSGAVNLCMPYRVIEPFLAAVASEHSLSAPCNVSRETDARHLAENVHRAPLEMRALLGETSISLNDLLSLQVGDVITTEMDAGAELVIQVEGSGKFLAHLGHFREHKALQIIRLCQEVHQPDAAGDAK